MDKVRHRAEEWDCGACWKQGRMSACHPYEVKAQSGGTACANHETAPARVNREVRALGMDMVGALAMEELGEERILPKLGFDREAFATGVYRFLVVVLLFVIALGVWMGPYSIINTIR